MAVPNVPNCRDELPRPALVIIDPSSAGVAKECAVALLLTCQNAWLANSLHSTMGQRRPRRKRSRWPIAAAESRSKLHS